jgi:hypothetical protein
MDHHGVVSYTMITDVAVTPLDSELIEVGDATG